MVSNSVKAQPLDEGRVLDAAFAVLEAHGFAGLTIRRIADELGVKNPALYWHFENKQQIVDRMAARLLDSLRDAPVDGMEWRDWLGGIVRHYRQTLLSHRDGAELLANANLSRSAQFAEFQRGIAHLAGFGFSSHNALLGMVTAFDYALGITYEHQADIRISGATRSTTGPVFASLEGMATHKQAQEALFDGGLELILDGLALRRG